MSSYISKAIVFFAVIYSLLLPSTMMNAFAEGHLTTNKIDAQQTDNKKNIDFSANGSSKRFLNSNANKENDLNKNNESSESGTPNVIASNIQTVS
ncbi:hypothetical protein FE394_18245, partial [Xenorhabdus sp. Reich]